MLIDFTSPALSCVHPEWRPILQPLLPTLAELINQLENEFYAGRPYAPTQSQLLRAFSYPLSKVKVLIVGQDPYPTPGHACGLSFSVSPHVRPVPRSLANIFTELRADLGCSIPPNGSLTGWAEQGVLLLNRVLSVQTGAPGSHRRTQGWKWEKITDAAISALAKHHQANSQALVAILWGKPAQEVIPLLGPANLVPRVISVHPSPLSAQRGFFGSRPFSRANELLKQRGATPINWAQTN